MDNRVIGERIRAARKRQDNMSQEKLAEKLGLSVQAVSSWETGKCVPDAEHLPALAKELDLSLDALFAETEHSWEYGPVNADPGRMHTFVKGRAQMMKLTKTLKVLEMLDTAHRGQPRKSRYGFGTEYRVHPLTLACHALALGVKDDDVIAACLAHDMVEDSRGKVTLNDLPEGAVRETVKLLSKNECDRADPDWEKEYYRKIAGNPAACLVKILDRVHNVAGMADAYGREWMIKYTKETDTYYPALLEALKKVPERNDAWWLLRYQLNTLVETYKRLL